MAEPLDRIGLRLARAAAAVLSPAGPRARLTILIFHRVRTERDALFPGEPTAEDFARQLDLVAGMFNVLPLPEAVERLRAGTLPARPACITFDDGYRDNAEVALPLLARRGLHATFFIATGFLDGGRMWNDTVIESVRRCALPALDLQEIGLGRHELGATAQRRAALDALIRALKHRPFDERARLVAAVAHRSGARLPEDLMMSSAQVAALARAGMEIGGHTVDHPILARLAIDEARRQIVEGRQRLEALTGRPVRLFAYPNGKPGSDYAREHVELVRDTGFEAAVSTAAGVATNGCDLFQLPRFTPWDRHALRLLRNLGQKRPQAA